MKTPNKYTLILFILFNILFISNVFTKEINNNSNNDIDFSKYYLKGLFSKKCFPEIDKDYCDEKYFHIYDNKIILNCIFDSDYYDKVPDGTYTLTTEKKSKINIVVKDNVVIDFKLLSSKKKFIKKEERVRDDNYCKIGGFNMWYGFVTQSPTSIIFSTTNLVMDKKKDDFLYKHNIEQNNIFFAKYKGKILGILSLYYYYIQINNKLQDIDIKLKITNKNIRDDNTYSSGYNNKNPDIIIKNCIVEYYNKDVLPLEFRNDNYIKYK